MIQMDEFVDFLSFKRWPPPPILEISQLSCSTIQSSSLPLPSPLVLMPLLLLQCCLLLDQGCLRRVCGEQVEARGKGREGY